MYQYANFNPKQNFGFHHRKAEAFTVLKAPAAMVLIKKCITQKELLEF